MNIKLVSLIYGWNDVRVNNNNNNNKWTTTGGNKLKYNPVKQTGCKHWRTRRGPGPTWEEEEEPARSGPVRSVHTSAGNRRQAGLKGCTGDAGASVRCSTSALLGGGRAAPRASPSRGRARARFPKPGNGSTEDQEGQVGGAKGIMEGNSESRIMLTFKLHMPIK